MHLSDIAGHNHRDIDAALAALSAAQERTIASDHPLLIVRGNRLVRIRGDSVSVLKRVAGRRKVTQRVKHSP